MMLKITFIVTIFADVKIGVILISCICSTFPYALTCNIQNMNMFLIASATEPLVRETQVWQRLTAGLLVEVVHLKLIHTCNNSNIPFLVDACTQTDEEDSVWLDDKSDSLSYQASPRSDTSFDLDCIRPESVSTAYDSDSDDYERRGRFD